MSDPQTIRGIMEQQKSDHTNCECRGGIDGCPEYERAVAALELLDNAAFGFDIDHGWREDRLIPDPGMNPELREDDPAPRGDAE